MCRLIVRLGDGNYTATGFLIARDTILTNHHVLFWHDPYRRDWTAAQRVQAWFAYEQSLDGQLKVPVILDLEPRLIAGDPVLDWAVIITKSPVIPDEFPTVPLAVDIGFHRGDGACIIQHPNGMVKQVGLKHNSVVGIQEDSFDDLTDTEGGSSGSPICTEAWQVIGLHRGSSTMDIEGRETVVNVGVPIRIVAEGLRDKDVAFTVDARNRDIDDDMFQFYCSTCLKEYAFRRTAEILAWCFPDEPSARIILLGALPRPALDLRGSANSFGPQC